MPGSALGEDCKHDHAGKEIGLRGLGRRRRERLILGYLMYRSGLVPRAMAMLGLIGGPLIIASGTAVLFDVFEPGSAPQVIATAPEFAWERAGWGWPGCG